jgi:hypothetical protein
MLRDVSGTWAASMQAALAATVARPGWWIMALAAFLVRGGFLLILVPVVSLPSASALATTFAPSIEAVALSRQSLQGMFLGTIGIAVVVAVLGLAGYAGSWLDLALLRDAAEAEELDGVPPSRPPWAWRSFGLRLAAHLPTFIALAYAIVRIVIVTYQELLSPGDPAAPIVVRVIARAPDALAAVTITWLIGEAIGGLAVRGYVDGDKTVRAIRRAIRELVATRVLATLLLTNTAVLAVAVLLIVVVGRAVDRLRDDLILAIDPATIAAAILLLASVWVLGLALLGAALAWRATVWTLESAHVREATEVREAAVAGGSPVS